MNLNYCPPKGWAFPTFEELALPEKGAIRIGPFGSALKKEEYSDTGIRVLGIDHVLPDELKWHKPKYIPEKKYEQLEQYTVNDGDILVTNMGTVGRTCVVPRGFPTAIISSHLIKSSLDQKRVYPPYISRVLNHSNLVTAQIKAKCHGAIMAGFNSSLLKSLKIPLPPLSEQKRIAAILDKADAIRRKRKAALDMADKFLRATFLDMFGDPVTNPKGWDSGTIIDVVANAKEDLRCGPFGTQLKVHEITDNGIPLLGIENVHDDHFEADFSKFITNEKAEFLNRFGVQAGDVLITRMGTIGRACVADKSANGARISYHLFRVRPDESKCLPAFLAATISKSGTFKAQLNRLAHGAIMTGLSMGILKEVKFLLPPIEKQKEFLAIVNRSIKQKTDLTGALSEADTLFASLSQRAFQGEL